MKFAKYFPGSFRDPSGRVFHKDGTIYRQINHSYKDNYDFFISSGLFNNLVNEGWLIPHEENSGIEALEPNNIYKIIKPERIPFISYPYEWCFSQLKDAALVTLAIQKRALEFGMSLKDSSGYNIQFRKNRPVFIDTLSFEKFSKGRPWVAYRQFCQHFLAPLVLMSYRDVRLSKLLRIYIDGIPMDLTSSLLPFYSYFKPSLLFHIHLHAKSQSLLAKRTTKIKSIRINYHSLLALLDNLESIVRSLKWRKRESEWGNYYQDSNYTEGALNQKSVIVADFLDQINPKTVWDLGANTGLFSDLAGEKGAAVISFDNDPVAVEKNYLKCVKAGNNNILPLLLDLGNPSPAIGWENQERMSLSERGPADAVLALALIHHLAISNNLPFERIANFFKGICSWLIIEFVPKDDSQAQKLLSNREDIFLHYTQDEFERVFSSVFIIHKKLDIEDSKRTIYLMQKKS